MSIHRIRIARHALAWLLLASGMANVIEATIPKSQVVADWMEQWVPLEVSQGSRLLILLFGLVQVMVSRGIFRGKKTAWLVASAAMGITMLLHLGRAWDWHHAAWSLLLFGILLWRRGDFTAASDAASLRWGFVIGGGATAALLIYSCTTVWHYAPQAHLRKDPVVIARAAAGLVLFQNLAAEGHHSKHALRAFQGIQLASAAVILGTLFLILRPVFGRLIPGGDENRARVERLIGLHGRDPMDCFALLPDKRWFFHSRPDGAESVVAYGLWRNYAVALSEPIGPEDLRLQTMNAFRDFCGRQDWRAAFYCCHESNRQGWERSGWQGLHVAEDARVHLVAFELKGSDYQSLRTNLNHARKAGWIFRWYDGVPVDHGLEAQMKLVSDGWLSAKGGTEMGFDLGAFSRESIRSHGTGCVLDSEGCLLAFATWPSYAFGRGRSIDLMRSAAGARGAMDFLILESIARFKAEGIAEVSLGNAPLARIATKGEKPETAEKVVDYLFEHFNQIYGYKPLFEFKRKYHPDWQGRDLVFERHAHLPSLTVALIRLHAPKGLLQMLRS
jgi:lysylphosphatidylglycerol synthetase-like protein (DUF2156 family)